MTQEEKAKRYDDLLVKLQEAKVDNNVCDDRYCCVIDDIVPELKESKESEDERIRQLLLSFVKYDMSDNYSDDFSKEDCLAWLEKQKVLTTEEDLQGKEDVLWCIKQAKKHAKDENEMGTCWFAEKWLEKQGEHANFRNKIQIGDNVTRNEDGVLVNLSQLKRIAKPADKQGEQKPNYCHHEVDLSNCSEEYRKAYYDGWNNCNQQHAQLEAEQKPAWNEDDDVIIDNILLFRTIDNLKFLKDTISTDQKYAVNIIDIEREITWLKSLKDRVQPQQKQEWSEEDDRMLDKCIKAACSNYYPGISSVRDWLRSLKNRYTWKPSEGQLECLGYATEKAEKDWSPLTNNRIYLTLKALKEQLEKLQ